MPKDKRLFARLDLDYADHPKIDGLSDAAFRAHVTMILHARKYMTDGVITKRFATRFASESLSELLANDEESPSLIALEDGSYLLHGYADMNETREEIKARSQRNTENGRRGGVAKASKSPSKSLPDSRGENVAETETETETVTTPKGVVPRLRGTRIPDPFIVTPEMVQWAKERAPLVDGRLSTERFENYWRAKTRDATKLDWLGTWQNWLLRDQQDAERQQKGRRLTPTERAQQTVAAGRRVAGQQITSLDPKEIAS